MPRYYKAKGNREVDSGNMKRAVEDILNNMGSLRQVAERYNLKKSTVALYLAKARTEGIDQTVFETNYRKSLVFTPNMEELLCLYLINAQKMFHGLTPDKVK